MQTLETIMKSKLLPLLLAALAPLSLLAAGDDSTTAKFTLSQATMVPGTTLQPGTYSIRVMDHLQDRVMLRIESPTAGDHTLFLGVPSKTLKGGGDSGVVTYGSGPDGKAAMRGFVFKGSGPALEFIYPKNDAVTLAKLNGSKVIAVDPTSEGKSEQLNTLSKDELQMVTLWMLTPQPVSGGEPGIAAAKYEQQVASVTPHRPAIAHLPHTASFFPLVMLTGFISAAGAALLAVRRRTLVQLT